MSTTTAMIVLVIAVLTGVVGVVLFHLAFAHPRVAIPLTVALAGMALMATVAVGVAAR
ncbi:hypothetical protein ABZ714_11405 [Streptomyces sp. NPDC006798]|uniref:hypothetical protein n=1 Tax=Streptomyces sp. NPDC006798 TaxID=3155462 RepID=UPI0033FBC4A0